MHQWVSVILAGIVVLGSGVGAYSSIVADVRVLQEDVRISTRMLYKIDDDIDRLSQTVTRLEAQIRYDKEHVVKGEGYAQEGGA